MNFTLRAIKDDEQELAFTIIETVLTQNGLQINPDVTDKDLSNIKKFYIEKGGCFKVVEYNGKIIGTYGLFPLSSTVCELRNMYLISDHQGKGLGHKMMIDALAEARQRQFKEIVLETNALLDKACKLYRKYGFFEYTPEHFSDRCDCAMKLRL